MNNTANEVLNEMKSNSSIDAEQILSKGIGSSSTEVQFYMDSARHLNLLGDSMSHYDTEREKDVKKSKRPAVKKSKKKVNKGGAPLKPIDYPKLSKMCAIHCTGEECASILDVSYEHLNNTLIKDGHGGFLDYFKKHSATGKMSLRRVQFTKAVDDGSIPMLIWLGKQYLGQKDKEDIHVDESRGEPLTINFTVKDPVSDVKVTKG